MFIPRVAVKLWVLISRIMLMLTRGRSLQCQSLHFLCNDTTPCYTPVTRGEHVNFTHTHTRRGRESNPDPRGVQDMR